MKPRGMSLVETIIALSVMSLITLLVANLFPAMGFTIKRSEDRLQADNIAISILNLESSRRFEDLRPGPPILLPEQVHDNTRFASQLEIFQAPDTDVTNVIGLRATVSWEERSGPQSVVHEVWVPAIAR